MGKLFISISTQLTCKVLYCPINFKKKKNFKTTLNFAKHVCVSKLRYALLPARASEQGNVIGSVRIYVCVQKKNVIERTRDLNYLKFVATDFSPKTISPSAGENSGDLA